MNRIDEITANIVNLAVEIVVNAANSTLLGGGGVDGAVWLGIRASKKVRAASAQGFSRCCRSSR